MNQCNFSLYVSNVVHNFCNICICCPFEGWPSNLQSKCLAAGSILFFKGSSEAKLISTEISFCLKYSISFYLLCSMLIIAWLTQGWNMAYRKGVLSPVNLLNLSSDFIYIVKYALRKAAYRRSAFSKCSCLLQPSPDKRNFPWLDTLQSFKMYGGSWSNMDLHFVCLWTDW